MVPVWNAINQCKLTEQAGSVMSSSAPLCTAADTVLPANHARSK
jgi:hypothetical protein